MSSVVLQPRPYPGPLSPQSVPCECHIIVRVCREGPEHRGGRGGICPRGDSHPGILFLPSPAKVFPPLCRTSLLWDPSSGPQGCWEQSGTVNNLFSCVSISCFKSLDFRNQGRISDSKLEPAHVAASSLMNTLHASLSEHHRLPGIPNQPRPFTLVSLCTRCPHHLTLPVHSTYGPWL